MFIKFISILQYYNCIHLITLRQRKIVVNKKKVAYNYIFYVLLSYKLCSTFCSRYLSKTQSHKFFECSEK